MKMFMSKNWRNNSGFTIIEAIIVILIMSLLASILTYRYNTSRETGAAVATDTLTADIQYAQAKAMAAGAQQGIAFIVGSGIYNISGEQEASRWHCCDRHELARKYSDIQYPRRANIWQ